MPVGDESSIELAPELPVGLTERQETAVRVLLGLAHRTAKAQGLDGSGPNEVSIDRMSDGTIHLRYTIWHPGTDGGYTASSWDEIDLLGRYRTLYTKDLVRILKHPRTHMRFEKVRRGAWIQVGHDWSREPVTEDDLSEGITAS